MYPVSNVKTQKNAVPLVLCQIFKNYLQPLGLVEAVLFEEKTYFVNGNRLIDDEPSRIKNYLIDAFVQQGVSCYEKTKLGSPHKYLDFVVEYANSFYTIDHFSVMYRRKPRFQTRSDEWTSFGL